MFIDIATMLWAVRLEPAHDENGKEIPPDTDTLSIQEWFCKSLHNPFFGFPQAPFWALGRQV